MSDFISEYKKQFKTETKELVVRISWCLGKGNSKPPMLGNYYKVQARFDMGIDVNTGKMIEEQGFNWLEWLAPKKLFGYSYGYKFKRGACYRLLVREYIYKDEVEYKKYYVEKVLEENVKESRLDSVYQFENEYEAEIYDFNILVKNSVHSWGISGGYRKPVATFIAYVDNDSDCVYENYGKITWIEKESKSPLHFKFDEMEMYRVKVRKSKENEKYFLLVDVIGKTQDNRLNAMKEKYQQPVAISNELGEFKLDRKLNQFCGNVDYFGELCSVNLEIEEGENGADYQLGIAKGIFSDLKTWDKNIREYVWESLKDTLDEWNEENITKEAFMKRIGVPSISVERDGCVSVMFETDDMFSDHAIEVVIDECGKYVSADIVG